MHKLILALCLSINISYASAVKLADFLVSSSGITEILAKHGIKGNDAKQVQSYIESSIKALNNSKSANISKTDFLNLVGKLPVTGQDANLRKTLQVLLDTPSDKIKKADVVEAINNLIYLANRHGKSVIITCAECVNEKLARDGFKFTVETITNASSAKLLNDVIPKNPQQLNTFIASRMRRLGMGDYSRVTPKLVAPEDEKSLALFLGLAESGTPDQKKLIEAIKKVSMTNGKVNIINAQNPHKLWKILADDMSTQDISGWTRTLEQVQKRQITDKVSTEEAFYRTLKAKANGDQNLTKQLETIKAKRCFFR